MAETNPAYNIALCQVCTNNYALLALVNMEMAQIRCQVCVGSDVTW